MKISRKPRPWALLLISQALWALWTGAAWASSPAEQVLCTTLPPTQWIGEKRMREIFGEKDYSTITFKVSRTHCYEFYAIRHDGGIVEAYYNPANGEVVKFNRLDKHGKYFDYSSSTNKAAASSSDRQR